MRQPSIQKIFMSLSLGTALLFLLFSIVLLQFSPKQQQNLNWWNQYTVKWSTKQILQMFEIEIPFFQMNVHALTENEGEEKESSLLSFLPFFTPSHPNDLIKQEIPGFSVMDLQQLTASNITDIDHELIESTPPEEFLQEKKLDDLDPAQQEALKTMVSNKKLVFIYHTHDTEAYIPEVRKKEPEIKKESDMYYNSSVNVTQVGKKLGEELNKLGIKSVVSTKKYNPEKFSLSYLESRKTVKAALQQNDYEFIFDIHRDSQRREDTTVKINGKDYAKIAFVIGTGNKNYEQNKAFALKLRAAIEKRYPGLTKPIIAKEKTKGVNGEYNQSLSPNLLVIEVGGIDNTFSETDRTAKALAEAVADLYWQAEQVDAKPQSNSNKE